MTAYYLASSVIRKYTDKPVTIDSIKKSMKKRGVKDIFVGDSRSMNNCKILYLDGVNCGFMFERKEDQISFLLKNGMI